MTHKASMSTLSPISASSVDPAAALLVGVLAATGPAEDELAPPVSINIEVKPYCGGRWV
jgi:hypothetical protein